MAEYTVTKKTVTTYRWELPVPATSSEVDETFKDVFKNYRLAFRCDEVPGDAVVVTVGDGLLFISFETREK